MWRKRQWRWAAALRSKNAHKWSAVAAHWNPELHSTKPSRRRRARPKKRWGEDFQTFLDYKYGIGRSCWKDLTKDARIWENLEDEFVNFWVLRAFTAFDEFTAFIGCLLERT